MWDDDDIPRRSWDLTSDEKGTPSGQRFPYYPDVFIGYYLIRREPKTFLFKTNDGPFERKRIETSVDVSAWPWLWRALAHTAAALPTLLLCPKR